MALLPLWFDTVNKRLVVGPSSPDAFLLPTFYHEDEYSIAFAGLQPTGNLTNPFYSRLNLTGYTLTISMGTAGSGLAVAGGFTLSGDSLLLRGTLSLNTAGIAALAD